MGKTIDLTGQRFGKLTVLQKGNVIVSKSGFRHTQWICRCDCGNKTVVYADAIKSGRTKSCGCLHKESAARIGRTVGVTHGKSKSRLYQVWSAMKRRCSNPNTDSYKHYGGRGISVCDEWMEFSAFQKWAIQNGYDEDAPRGKCTIDRIDVNGNYEPSNCRIITQKEQVNNMRTNHLVEYRGEILTISQLADKVGIPYNKLQPRITACGWDAERAVSTPFPKKGSEDNA